MLLGLAGPCGVDKLLKLLSVIRPLMSLMLPSLHSCMQVLGLMVSTFMFFPMCSVPHEGPAEGYFVQVEHTPHLLGQKTRVSLLWWLTSKSFLLVHRRQPIQLWESYGAELGPGSLDSRGIPTGNQCAGALVDQAVPGTVDRVFWEHSVRIQSVACVKHQGGTKSAVVALEASCIL